MGVVQKAYEELEMAKQQAQAHLDHTTAGMVPPGLTTTTGGSLTGTPVWTTHTGTITPVPDRTTLISWLVDATLQAEQSDHMITIQVEYAGIVLIGQVGDTYKTYTVSWATIEHSAINPILMAITELESALENSAEYEIIE